MNLLYIGLSLIIHVYSKPVAKRHARGQEKGGHIAAARTVKNHRKCLKLLAVNTPAICKCKYRGSTKRGILPFGGDTCAQGCGCETLHPPVTECHTHDEDQHCQNIDHHHTHEHIIEHRHHHHHIIHRPLKYVHVYDTQIDDGCGYDCRCGAGNGGTSMGDSAGNGGTSMGDGADNGGTSMGDGTGETGCCRTVSGGHNGIDMGSNVGNSEACNGGGGMDDHHGMDGGNGKGYVGGDFDHHCMDRGHGIVAGHGMDGGRDIGYGGGMGGHYGMGDGHGMAYGAGTGDHHGMHTGHSDHNTIGIGHDADAGHHAQGDNEVLHDPEGGGVMNGFNGEVLHGCNGNVWGFGKDYQGGDPHGFVCGPTVDEGIGQHDEEHDGEHDVGHDGRQGGGHDGGGDGGHESTISHEYVGGEGHGEMGDQGFVHGPTFDEGCRCGGEHGGDGGYMD